MQELAKSWVVLHLIGQSSAMAALLFSSAVPNLVLARFAGPLADRKGVREILIVTQILLSTLAFGLGLLVSTGHVQLWHLILFSLLEGSVIAFDLPAFNKITPSVVPKEDFQQALAVNAVNFHLSRVLGPSLAGLVMAFLGEQSVFWLNGLSFLMIVFVISRIPQLSTRESVNLQPKNMSYIWTYLRDHGTLKRVIVQLFMVIGLLFPLVFTVFRVYMQKKFHLTAQEFGFVFSAPGFGALLGSLSFLLWRPQKPLRVLPYGITGVVSFLVLLTFVNTLFGAILTLICFSFFMFLSISSLTVTIQLEITNEIRGRISALVGMAFTSLGPILSVPIGFAADHFGERPIMLSIAATFAIVSLGLALRERFAKGRWA